MVGSGCRMYREYGGEGGTGVLLVGAGVGCGEGCGVVVGALVGGEYICGVGQRGVAKREGVVSCKRHGES